MKKLIALVLCVTMVLATSLTAFAGYWEKDTKGWKYNNGDGTYYKSGWKWIDGNKDGKSECYYFSDLGYALLDTITPDGYTVNADGAWIVDKLIQYLVPTDAGPGTTPQEEIEIDMTEAPSGGSLEKYTSEVVYKGVDGTEKATVTADDQKIYIEVVSKKPSSQLTAAAAGGTYGGNDHFYYMQSVANNVLNKAGESIEIVETVKTSDGVTVYQCSYTGNPSLS